MLRLLCWPFFYRSTILYLPAMSVSLIMKQNVCIRRTKPSSISTKRILWYTSSLHFFRSVLSSILPEDDTSFFYFRTFSYTFWYCIPNNKQEHRCDKSTVHWKIDVHANTTKKLNSSVGTPCSTDDRVLTTDNIKCENNSWWRPN